MPALIGHRGLSAFSQAGRANVSSPARIKRLSGGPAGERLDARWILGGVKMRAEETWRCQSDRSGLDNPRRRRHCRGAFRGSGFAVEWFLESRRTRIRFAREREHEWREARAACLLLADELRGFEILRTHEQEAEELVAVLYDLARAMENEPPERKAAVRFGT